MNEEQKPGIMGRIGEMLSSAAQSDEREGKGEEDPRVNEEPAPQRKEDDKQGEPLLPADDTKRGRRLFK